MLSLLKEKYLYVFEEELIEEIDRAGVLKQVPKDSPMIDIGDKLSHMPLILDGAIRIMSEDKEGNELLLYYLEVGDSCAMTMSCCLGRKKSEIRAVTEKPTSLILIPVSKMEDWLVKYRSWRAFVFDSYAIRMKEMLEAIDILAFHNMEERLYKYLKDKAMVHRDGLLSLTHYQVATELNTSRVVVSRLMKKLALSGKIKSGRNSIEVLALTGK